MGVVAPVEGGKRTFSADGLIITLTAYGILFLTVLVYFVFFKNKESGTNADEVEEREE